MQEKAGGRLLDHDISTLVEVGRGFRVVGHVIHLISTIIKNNYRSAYNNIPAR